MGKIITGIVFLALAVYIVAVAVVDLEHSKITAREISAESTSILAEVNPSIVKYSGYAMGALGLILIAAGITRKFSPN